MSILLFLLLFGALAFALLSRPWPKRSWRGRPPHARRVVKLPDGFLWGVATSDHQIEHAQPDDWTAFEEEARRDGRDLHLGLGRPAPGHIHGITSVSEEVLRKKADWDARFEDDVALMRALDLNAHRMSLSWARLFPREDMEQPDPEGLAFYRRVFDAHEKHGVEPFVTLHHFATPQWLWRERDGKKGFERADAHDRWCQYVRAVVEHFGDRATRWCTINEPMVYVYLGFLEGVFPPGERRRDPRRAVPLMVELLRAHAAAHRILHHDASRRGRAVEVGLAHHMRVFEPMRDWAPLDRFAAHMVNRSFLWDFQDALHTGVLRPALGPVVQVPEAKGTQDYLGLNYYGRFYVKTDLFAPLGFDLVMNDPAVDRDVNDVGWASDPGGFRIALNEAKRRYGLPVYVLENGTADGEDDDVRRQRFLVSHVREMGRAVEDGVDVRGYFHWSFLDNFEWAEGFGPRFGLVKVDYDDGFKRTPRPSAEIYQRIAKSGSVYPELEEIFDP